MMAEESTSPRKRYYADWYQENKERISQKRKEAYRNDPEYRERVLAQSAEHREKRRVAPRVKIPRHQVPRRYPTGDGGEIVLFSIGFFSLFIARSVQSINEWEKAGILPRTPYIQGTRRFRFYSQAMMEAVRDMIGAKRRLYPVDPQMYEKIEQAWRDAGVPVGCEGGLREALAKTVTKQLKKPSDPVD